MNQKMAKNNDVGMIRNLHERLMFSAKSLTVKLVESSQPICQILGKHDSVTRENVILLLHRLQKMYQLKTDANKILMNFLKLEHDKSVLEKSHEDQGRLWSRLIQQLNQYEAEHPLYPKFVFDGYDLKKYATLKRENLMLSNKGKKEKHKLPVIGRSNGKPEEGRAISRERGFNYDTLSADDEYVQQRQSMLQEEKKLRASHKEFGPKNVPRFVHPDDRKRMAAVKSDHKYLQIGEDEPKI